MSDHYRTLGLQPNASKSDIKKAYFRLAQSYHPDHHAKADAAGRAAAAVWFRRVKDAYEVLSDDRRRADYDRTIRSSSSASGGGGYRNQQQYSGNSSSRSSGGGTSGSTESDLDWILKRARARGNGDGAYSSSSGNGKGSRRGHQYGSGASSRRTSGGGGTASSKYSDEGNPQSQYGGVSSGSSDGDTSLDSDPAAVWIWERARIRGHGDRHGGTCTSSSAASGSGEKSGSRPSSTASGGASAGSRPPPRVPRPMPALFMCCAGVLGGSALLWSMRNKRSTRKQQES